MLGACCFVEMRMGAAPAAEVEFEAAIRIVLEHATRRTGSRDPQPSERVGLLDGLGRVLARGVRADRDQPAFDRSTRDGFAVRAEEWMLGASLEVAGQVRAGEIWRGGTLRSGAAVEIMTGAPVPEGADAVVMIEHVTRNGSAILRQAGRGLGAGDNLVRRGSEAQCGHEVLRAGTRIGPAEIALAATCGIAKLDVFRQPRVAIVATGDELVGLDEQLEPQQIRNSNGYAIAAMVMASGGVADRLTIARDVREEIWKRVAQGRDSDLLVLSGGVSMGKYDLVEEVLAELGAEFLFTGVKMQPGRPVVFGRLPERDGQPECYFFGLPGNPVSTQVTFHCFAELFVRVLGGEAEVSPRWGLARLADAVPARGVLTRLLPARVNATEVRLVPWHGSGDLAANARATCYAELLPARAYAAGEAIRVLLR